MNGWTLLFRFSLAVLIGAVLFALYSLFAPSYHRLRELQVKKEFLEAQNAEIVAKLHDYEQRQHRFQTDPRFVERLIREQFGMARETETIYKIIRDAPPAVYDTSRRAGERMP